MRLEQINVWREEQDGRGPAGEMRLGDVRALLPGLIGQYAGQVQLIYLDPPFRTGQTFVMRVRVGEKEWKSGAGTLTQPIYSDDLEFDAYMALMRETLTGAKKLLSETGVIYLHADYRMHPYLRLLMDEVFGEANFLNEIIWSYQTGGRARRFFSRKHDVILFYRKSRKYYFNLDSVPISRQDARRNHMKRHVDADGRVYRSIKSGGKIYTYYDDEPAFPGDVWDDVSHLQQKDPQRTGYDTQKPMRLLERIILSSSKPGDIVCDLFSGSGTTLEAAWRSGRRFIGTDLNAYALQTTRRRMAGASAVYTAPPCAGEPLAEAAVLPGIGFYDVRLEKYEVEPGVCARLFSGLDAVDNWSVGYLREGVFKAYAGDFRLRQKPALNALLQLPVLEGTPCLRVGDVLGRYFYYALDISQGE
ncbi:MAG: site-specific DNA-methyltransferase [Clostridia bacterium]|nr:site-specific DNA-methyltransferase [Clostridia bacterium]